MSWNPHKSSSDLLFSCQRVLNTYPYKISIRQLFYQLVRSGELDLSESSYRKLKNLILNAKRKGRMSPSTFVVGSLEQEEATLNNLHNLYKEDIFKDQKFYVEIWVESGSMKEFVESVVEKLRIPVFVSTGYSDYSFIYLASRRISKALGRGLSPKVLALSNFSPQSLSMNTAALRELSLVFDMTEDEMAAVIFCPCVRLETVLIHDLPYFEPHKSCKGYADFSRAYGDILSSLGYPKALSVDIESLDPEDLAKLIFSTLGYILDMQKVESLISIEGEKRLHLAEALRLLEDQ